MRVTQNNDVTYHGLTGVGPTYSVSQVKHGQSGKKRCGIFQLTLWQCLVSGGKTLAWIFRQAIAWFEVEAWRIFNTDNYYTICQQFRPDALNSTEQLLIANARLS